MMRLDEEGERMMELVLIVALLGVFALAAAAFGTDSRDGDDWIIHRRA